MAACAVFDSENVLVEIYASKKEAKTHNKGTDLTFVQAKDFPEGGIGEYATVEELFPVSEETEGKDAPSRTRRASVALEGSYTVVKTDGGRHNEDDPRHAVHEALVNSDNFEDFFSKVPENYTFTTSRGAEITETPAVFARYALRRGWISVGEVEVVEEE